MASGRFGRPARVGLAVASALVGLLLVEGATRLLGLAPEFRPISLADDAETVYRRSANPILSYELKPGFRHADPDLRFAYPRINAHGQRDRERERDKPAGARRVSGPGWPEVLVVAVGGALGASGRYLIGKGVQAAAAVPFPVGTLVVNVAGCLAFGALFVLLRADSVAAVRWQLFLTTGLLGGFTTFSTFSQETVELVLAGRPGSAAAYAGASLAACLGATVLGGWLVALGR